MPICVSSSLEGVLNRTTRTTGSPWCSGSMHRAVTAPWHDRSRPSRPFWRLFWLLVHTCMPIVGIVSRIYLNFIQKVKGRNRRWSVCSSCPSSTKCMQRVTNPSVITAVYPQFMQRIQRYSFGAPCALCALDKL